MALRDELLKSVAVLALAVMHALGAPLVPAASMVAVFAIQAVSLMQVLLSPPCKTVDKAAAPVAKAASMTSAADMARYASVLALAIVFATALRFLGLAGSPGQVMALAGLGGGLGHCVRVLVRTRSGSVSSCDAHHHPAFWPSLDAPMEEEERTSPLCSLAEECFGPRSMLCGSSFVNMDD